MFSLVLIFIAVFGTGAMASPTTMISEDQWSLFSDSNQAPWAYNVWKKDFRSQFTWEQFRQIVAEKNGLENTDRRFARIGSGSCPKGIWLPANNNNLKKLTASVSKVVILREDIVEEETSLPTTGSDVKLTTPPATLSLPDFTPLMSGLEKLGTVLMLQAKQEQEVRQQRATIQNLLERQRELEETNGTLQRQLEQPKKSKLTGVASVLLFAVLVSSIITIFLLSRRCSKEKGEVISNDGFCPKIAELNERIFSLTRKNESLEQFSRLMDPYVVPFILPTETILFLGGKRQSETIFLMRGLRNTNRFVVPGCVDEVEEGQIPSYFLTNSQAQRYLVELEIIPCVKEKAIVCAVPTEQAAS